MKTLELWALLLTCAALMVTCCAIARWAAQTGDWISCTAMTGCAAVSGWMVGAVIAWLREGT